MSTPVLKVRVSRKSVLTAKVAPRFSAQLAAASPIVVTKNGITYTISIDQSAIGNLLPADIAYTDLGQTFTNKVIDTAGPNTLKINGNTLSAAAGTATITFQNAAHTVIGRDTTDTLSNKTIDTAATNTIKVNGNPLAATAGTGTITFQNTAHTVVGRATTDTLTNKTIDTAGPNTIKVNGNTLAATAGTATVTLPNSTDTLVGRATTDTLTNKTLDSAGTGNVLKVSGVTVSLGQFPGTNTNNSATAGNIGEFVSSSVAVGSAVSLVSGTAKDVTTISLTAGDWDVEGMVNTNISAGGQVSSFVIWTSQTANTQPTAPNNGGYALLQASLTTSGNAALPVGRQRFSLSGTTTISLGITANFSGTCGAYGFLSARRVR